MTFLNPLESITSAEVIATDPSDKDYKPERLWLIGQPLSADPTYKDKIGGANEGSPFSNTANYIPGLNSVLAIPHDKFGNDGIASHNGPLQLSIIPFIPIGYYAIIGKSIRNLYEKPKNNNSTGGKQ